MTNKPSLSYLMRVIREIEADTLKRKYKRARADLHFQMFMLRVLTPIKDVK